MTFMAIDYRTDGAEMTTPANEKLTAAVQRLTRMQRGFEGLSTTSRTPAEGQARIEDAQAIADVLAALRSQAHEIALLKAGAITAAEQAGRPVIV